MHFWAFIGSLLLASGVAMGAYGAHGLRAIVDVPRSIEAFEYAVQYQLISALGFFAIAWATNHFKAGLVNLAGLLLLIGSIGFSLSIYLLVLAQWETVAPRHPDLRRIYDRRVDSYGSGLPDL